MVWREEFEMLMRDVGLVALFEVDLVRMVVRSLSPHGLEDNCGTGWSLVEELAEIPVDFVGSLGLESKVAVEYVELGPGKGNPQMGMSTLKGAKSCSWPGPTTLAFLSSKAVEPPRTDAADVRALKLL